MSSTTFLFVSLLATLWLACRANNCAVQFIQNPENQTVVLGQDSVNISCALNVTGRVWRWFQRINNHEVSSSSDTDRIFNITNEGVLYFQSPVTIRSHGAYQCVIPGCAESYIGYLNVAGVPLLEFFQEPIGNNFQATAGGDVQHEILTFGSPTPSVTLRRKIGDSYTAVDASKVTLTTETFIMNGVERSDSGDYQIVATNTHGSYLLNFTLTVTGESSPCPMTIIPMSNTFASAQYDSQVLISCSTPEEAFDLNNPQQFMIEWRNSSGGAISNDSYFKVLKTGPTQLNLTIKSLTSDLNGPYTCFAENTRDKCMEEVMVIGPPAKIDPLNAVKLSDAHVTLSWTKPNAFGATVSKYNIRYRLDNVPQPSITVNSSPSDIQTHTIRFCPHGAYHFQVAAVNEHDSISEYSEEEVIVISANDCSTIVPNSSGTPGDSSISNTNSPNMTPTTTPVGSPASGTTTAIIAGSVAGLTLLAIASVLVMLTYCYVVVFRKRNSGRHEWSAREESPDMPVSSPPYDGKSPEPNGILAGLPSPIPLDGNGYMPAPYTNSNIDPRFEFPRENFEFTDVLFDGRQTVIYKATARGIKDDRCIDVAVKAIKEEFTVYDEYVSALLLEMEELAQLEPHPNVVGLIRVCTVGRPLYMVMEYMCHGDLLGFLRSTRGHENMYTVLPCNDNPPVHLKLTSRDLLRIATQISCGMQFLSERKIVHGALCARNILVGNSMEVKVFNIGCHNLYNEESFESLEKWLAPENISNGQRTTYGDVWSYGVLLWEVVTVGGTPYSEINSEDLFEQLQAGMRLPRPPHCAQSVYNIMEECWKAFPQDRPLFSDIYDNLDQLNLSKMSYLDLRSYDKTAYSQFDNEMSLTSAL